jgi:hypothetical protein
MRRWDRLQDSYLEEYRARGLSAQTVACTESRLDRWGRWLKKRRPRVTIESVGADIVLRCVRDELKGFPILEIPEWMFNAKICGRMKPAETPRVDCAALLALQHLLSAATECSQPDMVQAQHDSSSSGDADAQAVSVQEPSRRVVFSSREAPRVAGRSAFRIAARLSRCRDPEGLHHRYTVAA